MVWNEMEDTCALSDDRMLPTQTQPTFHFSRVFGGGGWLGVRVISAVSRFCFDPLSVRSTLVAGAKNRSENRAKNRTGCTGPGVDCGNTRKFLGVTLWVQRKCLPFAQPAFPPEGGHVTPFLWLLP